MAEAKSMKRLADSWRAPIYMLADSGRFESPSSYKSRDQFLHLPSLENGPNSQSVVRRGLYYVCAPIEEQPAIMPWHLRISATDANSLPILLLAARHAFAHSLGIAWLVDRHVLQFVNSDQAPHELAGTFIVLWPLTPEMKMDSVSIKLVTDLADYTGPVIPSAFPLEEGSVVHGVNSIHTWFNSPHGAPVPTESHNGCISRPLGSHGAFVSDAVAYFEQQSYIVSISSVHNSGLSLIGVNPEGLPIHVKIARRYWLDPSSQPLQDTLRTEYSILGLCAGTTAVPRAHDFIERDDAAFLITELPDGVTMHQYAMSNSPLTRGTSAKDLREFDRVIRDLLLELAKGLLVIRRSGQQLIGVSTKDVIIRADRSIAFMDLSQTLPATTTVDLLDVSIRDQIFHEDLCPCAANDAYLLGTLVLRFLLPITGLGAIKPSFEIPWLSELGKEFGLSGDLIDITSSLLCRSGRERISCKDVVAKVEAKVAADLTCTSTCSYDVPGNEMKSIEKLLASTLLFIDSSMEPDRRDCIYPADPEVYRTGAASLAHGAAGIMYALSLIGRPVSSTLAGWIIGRQYSEPAFPLSHSLLYGKAGIVLACLQAGNVREAEIFSLEPLSDGISQEFGLFAGVAGYGLSELALFSASQNELHLARATKVGLLLESNQRVIGNGCCWENPEGIVCHGFGYGAAGIAAFCIELYKTTLQERFLDLAEKSIEFELENAIRTPKGSVTWPEAYSVPGRTVPYIEYGSAGIGLCLIRLWQSKRDSRYLEFLEMIAADCEATLAILPGYFAGLAGIGHYYLDLHQHLGWTKFRDLAIRMAQNLELYAIPHPSGKAFPADGLMRISCDFATGSAGVATFLHRVLNGGPSPLFLD